LRLGAAHAKRGSDADGARESCGANFLRYSAAAGKLHLFSEEPREMRGEIDTAKQLGMDGMFSPASRETEAWMSNAPGN